MSFASLGEPPIGSVIDRFAGAENITLLVGAGASMEADLPSWPKLIERLLTTVATRIADLSTPESQRLWVERTLQRHDLLGAGAVVEVLASEPLENLVPEQLYGSVGAAGYLPGPIANQVSYLRGCFGERSEILTTNYDDLIEQALVDRGVAKSRIRSYIQDRAPEQRAANAVAVTHLHGVAGRAGPARRIVLTEEHYHRMQRGSSWQERLVTKRLEESLCLFVGMSLADPNLIRYLYGYDQARAGRHAAIFVRQGEENLPADVRAAGEQAAIARWARCGVEAVFVDHYADAAQLLYEIGLRRQGGNGYVRIGERADQLIATIENVLLRVDDDDAFAERQVVLSTWLRRLLYGLIGASLDGQRLPADEKLAVALWFVSRDGRKITGWAHSDRAHQDPSTIAAVDLTASSDWVSTQAVCRGSRVELDRTNYASRWRFVRGLPLVIESPARVPVGCVTVSSTKPGAESVLTQMPAGVRSVFHRSLLSAARILIDRTVRAGEPR